MRRWAWAVAAGMLAATGAYAGEKPPKPPASLDAKGIDAWIRQYVTADGWVLLAADAAAVTYGRGDIAVMEDGLLQADVRREYFRPARLGAMNSRSNQQTWQVDCAHQRFKVISMQVFMHNNLKGESFRRADTESDWSEPEAGSPNAQVLSRICAAAPPRG